MKKLGIPLKRRKNGSNFEIAKLHGKKSSMEVSHSFQEHI
jgi:hypothetical protein